MQKPVNNLTEAQVTLGGVEIDAKSQRVVRESLISDEEKRAVVDSGAVLTVSPTSITVAVKEVKDADAEAEAEAKALAEAEAKAKAGITDVAYPAELIKIDGGVNGSVQYKATVAELQEKYGETILDDNAFKAKYPEADIEAHRVEAGE